MDFPRVIQTIQAIIGLGLNILVIYITSFKQKLNGLDLKLMLVVALLDIVFYINCLTRVILYQIFDGDMSKFPEWWCFIDSTLTISNYQSSLEIVAILGLLRYYAIELNRRSTNIWKYLTVASIFFSLLLNAINFVFKSPFRWSTGNLICVPTINQEKSNEGYFYFWFIQLCIRIVLSFVTIAFCYIKIAILYRRIMSQPISSDSESWTTERKVSKSIARKPSRSPNEHSDAIFQVCNKKIERMKETFTLKLIGFVIIYFIILVPYLIVVILYLSKNYDLVNSLSPIAYIFVSFCGIINALFVLFAHDPSQRILKEVFIKSKSHNLNLQGGLSLPSTQY